MRDVLQTQLRVDAIRPAVVAVILYITYEVPSEAGLYARLAVDDGYDLVFDESPDPLALMP